MNEDQFKGKIKQLKGEIKKQWSKITDDDLVKIEGKRDIFEGKIQERYGKNKEEAKKELDQFFKKHPTKE